MTDKLKPTQAQMRFIMRAEEIEVTHIPQWVGCRHNIGYDCAKFGKKPGKCLSNENECPLFRAIPSSDKVRNECGTCLLELKNIGALWFGQKMTLCKPTRIMHSAA